MRWSTTLVALSITAITTQALPFSNLASSVTHLTRAMFTSRSNGKRAACPAVWTNISSVLTADFVNSGQCSDDARGAVRAAFHDCFNGACDGSIFLAGEYSNSENKGISDICQKIGSWAKQYGVGVADLIQFAAGASPACCP